MSVQISEYKTIKFKDSIDDSLMSSLVYKFNCNKSNCIYVDKTKRHFANALELHKNIITFDIFPFSAILEHVNNPNHENYPITSDQKHLAVDKEP